MNAAERLAERLHAWQPARDVNPFDTRGGARKDAGVATYREITSAANLIGEVEAQLDALAATGTNVAPFRDRVPAWYGAVFSVNQSFLTATTNPPPVIDPNDLAMLEALGAVMQNQMTAMDVPQSDREALAKLLDEAEHLVTQSVEIADKAKIGLLSLIAAVRMTLDRLDTYGSSELRTRATEAAAAMSEQAAHLSNQAEPDAGGGLRDRMVTLSQQLLAKVWSVGTPAAITAVIDETAHRAVGGGN